ncbi:cdkn1a interacting zinc finger protein 1b [Boleophthalmus pectinirostris]|uniref:cdkn1a interacting zinc finger protein 1b n=1 Tax=Boleophthalmus pectinirostris TaxID=150288 RepID=UPI002432CF2D|nr:cdkn1a interacting zinc finger protein 1b [Boleophthalmus pectinirostris]
MMVKQQQRRTDRCFLPGGSNNVTLVRFPTPQRCPHPSHEGHQPPQAPVRETQGEHGEPETKRICISGSEQSLDRETAPESCDQTGSNMCSSEDRLSPGDESVQQVVLENNEDNRATELASGGCLKVTIQRSSESREFGEKDPANERFTCHLCHCTCPSAQSFHEHMSGVDHNRRLQQVSQSVTQPGCAAVVLQESCRRRRRASVRWCDVCQSNFTGDVILHRRTIQHKECKKWSRPFCSVCHRLFRTPRKFVEHMKSPAHKQKVQLEKSQEDDMITVDAVGCFETETKEGGDKEREETSEGDKDAQLGERLGSIDLEQRGDKEKGDKELEGKDIGDKGIRKGAKQGDQEEEMELDQKENRARGDEDIGEKERGDKEQGNKERGDRDVGENERGDKERGNKEREDKDIREKEQGDEDIEEKERGDKGIEEKERGDRDIEEKERGDRDIGEKERGDKDIGEKERGDEDIGDEEGFDAEDLTVDDFKRFAQDDVRRDSTQELNPQPAHGESFVVPVSGFFCLLCHKFFFRETSAREQHCSSPQHLQRVLQR